MTTLWTRHYTTSTTLWTRHYTAHHTTDHVNTALHHIINDLVNTALHSTPHHRPCEHGTTPHHQRPCEHGTNTSSKTSCHELSQQHFMSKVANVQLSQLHLTTAHLHLAPPLVVTPLEFLW